MSYNSTPDTTHKLHSHVWMFARVTQLPVWSNGNMQSVSGFWTVTNCDSRHSCNYSPYFHNHAPLDYKTILLPYAIYKGLSNHWTGKWTGMVEWTMHGMEYEIFKIRLRTFFRTYTQLGCIAIYLLTCSLPALFCTGFHSCIRLEVVGFKGH